MNKPNVKKLLKTIKSTANHNSPAILIGVGIAGMITTTVLAVKATPKALKKIEEKKVEVYESLDPSEVPSSGLPEEVKLTPVEVIKTTWKCYIPAAVTCTASIACIIGSSKINAKRNAALVTAYNLSQTALTEYKDKVVETIGEKKEKKIREDIAQDKATKSEKNEGSNVLIIGDAEVPCFDIVLGTWFSSTKEDIREAVNNINEKLIAYDYVSVNEFYDELDIPRFKHGDDIGWNISRDGQLSLEYSPILDKKGRPGLGIEYRVEPRYDYSKLI